jgi:acetyl esterase/lipase
MFTYPQRSSLAALVSWTAVLLIFLAAGACSTPKTPAPEKLAAVPLTGQSTATRLPTPLPPLQARTYMPPSAEPSSPSQPAPALPPLQARTYMPPSAEPSSPSQTAPALAASATPDPLNPFDYGLEMIEPGPYEVQLFPEIPFTSRSRLDVYAPSEPGEWPVVIAYHGGLGTPKEVMGRLARSVASYGAVVFVPTWRTTVSPILQQGAEDAACAIRFARKYAVEYGGVPDRVIGAGHSAGAWVAALMGLIGDDFAGDCLVEGGSGYLDGIVALEGPYNLTSFSKSMFSFQLASPEFWEKMSPVLYPAQITPREGVEYHIFASDSLPPSKREDTDAFFSALQDAGYSAQLTVLHNIPHPEFDKPLPETVQAILDMAWGGEGWQP